MEVKNRYTEELRRSSVWQLMADKWNDPMFLPITTALPDVHSEFALPIPLAFETVSHMQPATVEKVEERWQSMNLQLNHIISNWEHSGHEDGNFIEHSIWQVKMSMKKGMRMILLNMSLRLLGIIHSRLLINESNAPVVRVSISFTSGKCLRSMTCSDHPSKV